MDLPLGSISNFDGSPLVIGTNCFLIVVIAVVFTFEKHGGCGIVVVRQILSSISENVVDDFFTKFGPGVPSVDCVFEHNHWYWNWVLSVSVSLILCESSDDNLQHQ